MSRKKFADSHLICVKAYGCNDKRNQRKESIADKQCNNGLIIGAVIGDRFVRLVSIMKRVTRYISHPFCIKDFSRVTLLKTIGALNFYGLCFPRMPHSA